MTLKQSTQLYLVIIAFSAILLLSGCTTNQINPDKAPNIEISGINTDQTFSLEQLKDLETVSGYTEFQNQFGNWRGYGLYEGVKINKLLDSFDFTQNDLLQVVATDDYQAYYTYNNVYPDQETQQYQGDMVLAYSYNETEVPDYEDGYRIIFMPDDNKYSNSDMVKTTSLESRGEVPSGGSRWVKNVKTINIIRDNQTLTVAGNEKSVTYTMTQIKMMPTVTGYGQYINSYGTLSDPHQVKGVSLLILVNETSDLSLNFDITLTASDNYKTTFTEDQVFGQFETYDSEGTSQGVEQLQPIIGYETPNDASSDLIETGLRLCIVDEDATEETAPITSSSLWAKDVVEVTFNEITAGPTTIMLRDAVQQEQSYDLDDLKLLPEESGTSRCQNIDGNWSSAGLYHGVNVSGLFNGLEPLIESDLINVTSSTGVSQYYTYQNIFPTDNVYNNQGSMILAYSYNNTEIPDYSEGYRIVFLAEDQQYSNQDMINSTSLESRGEGVSSETRWLSKVASIEVIRDTDFVEITGSERSATFSFTQLTLMPSLSGYGSYYRDKASSVTGPHQFTGANLTYVLNAMGLPENFHVDIIASDDYVTQLSKDNVFGQFETFDEEGNSLGINAVSPIIGYASEDFIGFSDELFRICMIEPNGSPETAPITSSGLWAKYTVQITVVEV